MKKILYVGNGRSLFLDGFKDIELTSIKSGKTAIQMAKKHFDLILIDIVIEDISSWELLNKLKKASKSKFVLIGSIPVSMERIESLKNDGFYEYILKDRDTKIVYRKIKSILDD